MVWVCEYIFDSSWDRACMNVSFRLEHYETIAPVNAVLGVQNSTVPRACMENALGFLEKMLKLNWNGFCGLGALV